MSRELSRELNSVKLPVSTLKRFAYINALSKRDFQVV